MLIYRQRVVLATTLSWWWLSSLLLIVPNSIAVAAVDDASSTAGEALKLARFRRRAQDGINNEDTSTTITTQIVGGDIVPDSKYPYYVWLSPNVNGTNLCGGTVIHPDIVLTSATCSGVFAAGRIINGYNFQLEIEKTFVNPSYVASTLLNDIMLVKMKGKTSVTPVSLNQFRLLSWPRRSVDVIGYGVQKADGTGAYSEPLRRVTLRIGTRAQCKANFGTNYDRRTELCAGAPSDGKGICVGDLGGPLLVGNVQHGIASYATSPCGKAGASSGFTRVSRFYEWIWYYACELSAVKTGKCA